MKHLLILLLSALTLNGGSAKTDTIYRDRTSDAINSGEPKFFACNLGFQLRPVTCTDGYDGNYCKGWGRHPYTNDVISTLIDKTFPKASQLKSEKIKNITLLSDIAQDAYRGRVFNQPRYPNGRDDQWLSNNDGTTQCREHGWGPGA